MSTIRLLLFVNEIFHSVHWFGDRKEIWPVKHATYSLKNFLPEQVEAQNLGEPATYGHLETDY